MDIISYITSKDVREHLHKIEFEPNLREGAFIIWQSTDVPLAEKIEKWKELMEDNRGNDLEFADVLRSYTDVLEKNMERFYDDGEENVVYTLSIFWKDEGEKYGYFKEPDSSYVFRSLKECKWFIDDMEYGQNVMYINVQKTWLDDTEEYISMIFNLRFTAVDMRFTGVEKASPFEGLSVSVPVPFHRGDLVIQKGMFKPWYENRIFYDTEYGSAGSSMYVFPEQIYVFKRRLLPYPMKIADMGFIGFITDGNTIRPTTDGYNLSLEYYRGPLEGEQEMLAPVSKMLKKDISLGDCMEQLKAIHDRLFEEENWEKDTLETLCMRM